MESEIKILEQRLAMLRGERGSSNAKMEWTRKEYAANVAAVDALIRDCEAAIARLKAEEAKPAKTRGEEIAEQVIRPLQHSPATGLVACSVREGGWGNFVVNNQSAFDEKSLGVVRQYVAEAIDIAIAEAAGGGGDGGKDEQAERVSR